MAEILTASLQDAPHTFLQPSLPLYTDALAYLKHALDPLAVDVGAVQQRRLQDARKKRKRGQHIPDDDVLRLQQIHTQGLGIQQVWAQAKRVIDAAREEAEKGVADAEKKQSGLANNVNESLEEVWDDETEDESELGEEGVDYEVEGVDVDDDEEIEDVEEGDDLFEGLEDDEDIEMEDGIDDEQPGNGETAEEFVADKFGLNDGFFSIDDFNRKSEFLEQQDARGDDDDAASDEEDVDWDANPLAHGIAGSGVAGVAEESADDDGEDGPTFGDPDASSEDQDEEEELDAGEMDAMGDMSNTNHITYADFFAPPAQKKKKNKKGRPNSHNFPEASATNQQTQEDEMERTMAAVHRDLFEDEESEQDEEDRDGLDPSDPKSRRSTHERRKAAIAEEIRKLEAANVAKREWMLSGEARAADRPMNSLLEQDLEFERTGKPVPVITAEVSESIEELVKRRILAHEFQDIIRRRPDDLATGKDAKRGRLDFQLDDSKSKKGLAEEYEEEHLRRTDPNFVDVKDEKLKKEEGEIEAQWKKICADLDGLSSWHFRPKQAAPQLEIRVDAPAIAMEDARPSAGGDVAGASQLAPQEIYKAGEGTRSVREEVVGKSGLPAGREELGREEKKRRRRREKERIRKAGGNESAKESRGSREKKEVLKDLKRGGVSVIGKKGDITDVEGRGVKNGSGGGQVGAGRYKL